VAGALGGSVMVTVLDEPPRRKTVLNLLTYLPMLFFLSMRSTLAGVCAG
jgi:hypothetical protein